MSIRSRIQNRRIFILVICLIMVGLLYHLWAKRYYLRFIPIPLSAIEIIDKESWLLPASQEAAPLGQLWFETDDLTTETGLQKTLASIQGVSPFAAANGVPSYVDIDFDRWVQEIRTKPFFCTDATQLFILAAWSQGLKAREWHLVPPGWPSGQGHSVVEFFNPKRDRWQLVDAQHAAVFRDNTGQLLGMSDVLRHYFDQGKDGIAVDYGDFDQLIRSGARGPTSEQYFFESGLLNTPILQLRQSTWFAKTPRKWLLSGHFVIGYPIITGEWTHDNQVLLTKASAVGFLVLGLVLVAAVLLPLRYSKS